jgi:signal transduction histidine kinase
MTARPRRSRLATRLAWRLAAVMIVAMALAAGAVGWRAVITIANIDQDHVETDTVDERALRHEMREALEHSLRADLLTSGLVILAPLGVVAVLIGLLTVRQGLRPLRQASAAAAKISPGQPGVRLPEDKLPGEVQPLVHAVNQALDRLETAFDAQRRFVGEAAHTLRTPLAVLTARLDELEESGADSATAGAALRRDVDRMARLVDQLLKMARLDGRPMDVSRPVDLHDVAVEAISALAPLALRQRIELGLEGSAPPVPGNHAALVIALTNLIENAMAHTKPGGAVEVEVAPRTLRVLDRGPGVPEADRERIFGSFQRGRGARETGAGLGLAIVANIAAAHGGTAAVTEREGGGACFTLTIGEGRRP